MLRIGSSSHGESRLRMLRIVRPGDGNDARELTVSFRSKGISRRCAGLSVQHTLFAIAEVTLALHERPYRPADLFSAGLENPDDLFVSLDKRLGVMGVTVERDASP